MGILDAVLGGTQTTGAQASHERLIQAVVGMLMNRSSGGLNGLVQAFESQGLGHLIGSWVGNGNNLPVSPDQVHQALGQERVQQIANQSGLSVNDTKSKLAQVLPELVNRATPDGRIPEGGVPQQSGLFEQGLELLRSRM